MSKELYIRDNLGKTAIDYTRDADIINILQNPSEEVKRQAKENARKMNIEMFLQKMEELNSTYDALNTCSQAQIDQYAQSYRAAYNIVQEYVDDILNDADNYVECIRYMCINAAYCGNAELLRTILDEASSIVADTCIKMDIRH